MANSLFKFSLLVVTLLLAPAAGAGNESNPHSISYDKGLSAYEKGDKATALMIWFPLAESGDADAQLMLARIYRRHEEPRIAIKWYREAAERGNLEAQTTLGLMYSKGQQVEKDPRLAARYLLMATRNEQAAARVPVAVPLKLDRKSAADDEYFPMAARSRQARTRTENRKQLSPEEQTRQAEAFERGMQAYQKQDYTTALMHWLPVTEHTPGHALYMIGRLYLEQDDEEQDLQKAEYWMTRAALRGYLPAQSRLGLMYFEGDVFERDLGLAAKWLLEASEASPEDETIDTAADAEQAEDDDGTDLATLFNQGLAAYLKKDYVGALLRWYPLAVKGHVNAQFMLGNLYLKEEGLYRDPDMAMDWYKRAIAQGHIKTTRSLAMMYLQGDHVEKDVKVGLTLLLRAARLGDLKAQFMLANMYFNGDRVKTRPAKAAYWYQQAAEQNHPDAQFALAEMYQHGKGITRNREKALHWYKEASENNHQQAALILARHYYQAGPGRDYEKAFALFSNAAKQGEVEAQYYLGEMYFNGQGTDRDMDRAFEWYARAARMEYTAAQYSIGKMYVNGYGVKRDFKKGVEYFLKAAKKGHGQAQKDVGVAYYTNQGVERDPIKAYAWFYLASQKSVEGADINRNRVYKSLSVRDQKQAIHVVAEFKKAYP